MQVYRISPSQFIKDLSGYGARLTGGRWNQKGIGVIYTSESRPLAALEYLVHFPAVIAPSNLAIATIQIPDKITADEISISSLPRNWKNSPPPIKLAEIGSKWIISNNSLLLRVPSAVLSDEFNILINPSHPDSTKIIISHIEPFEYDPRIKK